MSQKDSPHEFDPKHRIIGAIVIVALAIIFVPMILSKREPPAEAPAAPATAQNETPNETAGENKVAVTKVAPPPPTLTEPVKIPPPTPSAEATKPASAQPTPPPVVSEPPKVAAAAKPPVAAPTAKTSSAEAKSPASSGWVVQVGTFSNSTNATRLEQKLRAAGQPVRAERVQLDSGKAVRLRVGPFRDRAAAVKAQERIQKDVDIKGVVLAYP